MPVLLLGLSPSNHAEKHRLAVSLFIYLIIDALLFVVRGGLSWWDAQSSLRVGRWTWAGDTFNPAEAVILESTAVGVGVNAAHVANSVPGSSPRSGAVDVVDGGDPRPCVACVSQRGEVRVLRLGGEGAEELFRSAPAAAVLMRARGTGVLTVPSPARHQFLLVTRLDLVCSCVCMCVNSFVVRPGVCLCLFLFNKNYAGMT